MINHAAHFVNMFAQKNVLSLIISLSMRVVSALLLHYFVNSQKKNQPGRKDTPHGRATLYGINKISKFLSPPDCRVSRRFPLAETCRPVHHPSYGAIRISGYLSPAGSTGVTAISPSGNAPGWNRQCCVYTSVPSARKSPLPASSASAWFLRMDTATRYSRA